MQTENEHLSPKNLQDWTIDDLVNMEEAGEFEIAPDCRQAVWVKSVPDEEKGEKVSHLFLSDLSNGKESQLTRGRESCHRPRWSPEGDWIAFLSERPQPGDDDAKEQIWLLPTAGGEPWALTSGERAVKNYEWASADAIIFTMQELPTLREQTLKDKEDKTTIVEDEENEPPVRLFQVDVDSRKVTRLTHNDDRIRWFSPSPDGRWAVALHEDSLQAQYDQSRPPIVRLHDLQSGGAIEVMTEAPHVKRVEWARDGAGFYAISRYTTHPRYIHATLDRLYYYDLAGGQAQDVDLDWERGLAVVDHGFDVTDDGFVALLADGTHTHPAQYRREGETWQRFDLSGDHVPFLFNLKIGKDDQTVVYDHSTASTPVQWYRATLTDGQLADPVQITELNDHLDEKDIARTEVVRWQGALDEEVEGILYYPHDYQAGENYPLVVMIHGGPFGVDADQWAESHKRPANLLNQRGAFVFKPNYHGSRSYGLEWAESIGLGKYCTLEVEDIEKGVDALIKRGLVDPERLGIMGWSNGGILTAAITSTTDRYRAACAGAGTLDWVSDWGNCKFGASFDNYYLGTTPLADPDFYRERSPFYRMDQVRTPTLILFGDEDRTVPTQQGWMHYRALQQMEQTDVRFVLFPGQEHSLKKLAFMRRKVEEELAWFDRYLFEMDEEKSPALKPGSPLDRALTLQNVARVAERYGVDHDGVLIPEVAVCEGVEIGRFEVTRAQFAAFDPGYEVAPGTENYPANGVSFEQARDYCAWLSKRTGAAYRLVTAKEWERLAKKREGAENTLDYWAGYAVNPDDAARLRPVLDVLGPGVLLRAVGSFGGAAGDDPVFDLGGNVAEWGVSEDGEAQLFGASADTPADPRWRERQPAPEYVGFRVVREAE
jgi:dipeptidyl aminopeptidase/acylaminoacyl peptidase